MASEQEPLTGHENLSPDEAASAIFAGMVVQQTNMAMMFLGRMPHPETGEHFQDLETARIFIDQLEMLEKKTKGNLDEREKALLQQSLSAVRLAFVEAANQQVAGGGQRSPAPKPADAADSARQEGSPERKRFTKKY